MGALASGKMATLEGSVVTLVIPACGTHPADQGIRGWKASSLPAFGFQLKLASYQVPGTFAPGTFVPGVQGVEALRDLPQVPALMG